jgi:uroporphyrinogen-III synthase
VNRQPDAAAIVSSTRPLAGRRVLVTRARAQAPELVAALQALGAEPVLCPLIEIVPPEEFGPLDRALGELERYDWVVFTSVNGVDAFFRRLTDLGRLPPLVYRGEIAAIGPATARRVHALGLDAHLVPSEFVAEAVADALVERGVAGKRVLVPRAAEAREVLPALLRAAGAVVDVVPAYRTVPLDPPPEALERLRAGEVDIVLLLSGSTARALAAALGTERGVLERPLIACIGPVTAAAARQVGIRVDLVADEYSVPGLLRSVVSALEEGSP